MRFLKIIAMCIRLAGQVGIACLKVPFNLLDYALTKVFGSSEGRLNSARMAEAARGGGAASAAESVAESALEAVQARALTAERNRERQSNSIGEVVYAYASATPADRPSISLSGVPTHVQDWLLGLPEVDLRRLAIAGRTACQKASEGQRCGVVGIAYPPTYGAVAVGEAGLLSRPAVELARQPSRSDLLERVRERIVSNIMKPV
jgi:hypothetical protein